MCRHEARNLLYFNNTAQPAVMLGEMNAAGWEVKLAQGVGDARRIMEDCAPRVAVAQLDDRHEAVESSVQQLFCTSRQTEWVALLPKSCIDSGRIRQVISDVFHDFHTLPVMPDRVLATLGHAYGMAEVKRKVAIEQMGTGDEDEMVGSSPQMLDFFKSIRKAASVDAPVLITGESGTGKELAALAIHERSARAGRPFVAVNCGALPGGLIQSELFGHEKGAFTGAIQRKVGRIESADSGTIFLDEIGDLPFELQANLLRFLQERTIERVGGTGKIGVDVRVIAATHVDMETAVAEGRFREDLYYRLNVLRLKAPSLREREGDIELLARYFFTRFAHEKRPNVRGFSAEALRVMTSYTWRGNVRELINRIRRAMVMCENRLIGPADLGLDRRQGPRRVITLETARKAAEKGAIHQALMQHRNNLSEAARELGVSRVTLYRLIEKYGLASRLRHSSEAA
ncbi:MAG TPA: sigma-54 dependent transcriptional regulator [Methylophilaceae bacterium]